ncbi:hypothetical protein ALC62_11629 [Cyphomyrmex costatus]|uniref:Uncharacterized protein n=1 Tax=Cyphomyrmex costatus TaxID=456900 RepID=A0A151IC72_9HYME|nr:hypothetical protein ALC62_11629 [Cyphomyrmex costatus]
MLSETELWAREDWQKGGFSGWKRLLGTPGKKGSEQRGEKLYLKNLSGPSASLDIFPSRVEISTSPKITSDILLLTLREKDGNISSINFRLILLDSTKMDVDGEHECYEMETDAFLRPRDRGHTIFNPLSKFGPGSPSTFMRRVPCETVGRYRPSFHVERCPQGGHLYVLRGSFDGLAGFAVPETDTKGEPQRTRMDAPLTRTQKTDTKGLQKLLINTDDEYTKPQRRVKNFGTKATEEHCCRILLRGRTALREQDGVTETREKCSEEKKNKRKKNQKHLAIVIKSGLARIRTCTYGDLERGDAPASEMSVVHEQGRGYRRGAWGYPENVTRAGTVASARSRVNVSRGKARRKLCREGSRLGAWDARKIWDGRGITGRKSQDNRNEIGPTVKNVGFLKVNIGRTAEESRIRRQIIVRTIEVRISELRNAVCSLLVAVVIDVEIFSETGPEVTPFQIDPSIKSARVARCDGGVKCAVITGDRGEAGKKVVNMTPIFLVVLLAIDPIIAQNTGE